MPGYIVQQGAVVTCPHGGKVTLVGLAVVNLIGGAATQALAPMPIAGCSLTPKPCTLLTVLTPSTRVFVGSSPVYLMEPAPNTVSDGTTPGPALVIGAQTRVWGI